MNKLSPKGTRILKIIHLIFAAMWLGGALGLTFLLLDSVPDNSGAMFMRARAAQVVDDYIIIPGALGCLFTGLVYSIWTNWGFFKHKWVTVKWILTVAMILFGTFVMGPMVNGNVYLIEDIDLYNADNITYFKNVSNNITAGLFQITAMLFVFVISVIKPWRSKRNA